MRTRRGSLAALALLIAALSACSATPPATPAPSAPAPSADPCAGSEGARLLTPPSRMTPRDLCEADGQAWAPAEITVSLESYDAYVSDDAACEAAWTPWDRVLTALDRRLTGMTIVDPDDPLDSLLGRPVVSVLAVEHPGLAADADRTLAGLADACIGTAPAVYGGIESRIERADVDGWAGVRLERSDVASPRTETDVRVLWRLVDDRLVLLQVPAETDAETLATALEVQGGLLETPREPEPLPDDCSASDDGDPSAPPTMVVTPADLCAIDGLPWVHAPYSTSVEYLTPASIDPTCLAIDQSAYSTPFDLTSTGVRVAGGDAYEAEIGVGVVADETSTELAADLDAVAGCAGTTPIDYQGQTQTLERIEVEGWSGVRIVQTANAGTGLPDPMDVEQYWAVVDGTLAFLQIPVAVDDDVARTVLDAQLAAIGG